MVCEGEKSWATGIVLWGVCSGGPHACVPRALKEVSSRREFGVGVVMKSLVTRG